LARATLVLKPGREKSLAHRHPWIFSGAIDRVEGTPGPGATVAVHAHDGSFLAVAAFSPASQIRARAWTFVDEPIDAAFFARRVRAAVDARAGMLDARHDACRLVHAESDDSLTPGQNVSVAVRPEKVGLGRADGANVFRGTVDEVVYIGTDTHYRVRLPGGAAVRAREQNGAADSRPVAQVGDEVTIAFPTAAARVLAA